MEMSGDVFDDRDGVGAVLQVCSGRGPGVLLCTLRRTEHTE